jgi:hypothetical protein
MWNPEEDDQFIQEELFDSNLTPVAGTSNFLTPIKPQTIKGRERDLRENLPDFRVIRSGRRKRSIQAFRQNGSIEIHIPDRLTRKQELELIPEMIQMVLDRETKERKSDDELMKLASAVLAEHLPDFDLAERPKSITWRSMRERWGSCTTVDRTIRISDRLNTAPMYALKHVILHELIHLRIADHGPDFEALLARDPDGARAEAFLEGFELGSSGNSDIYL